MRCHTNILHVSDSMVRCQTVMLQDSDNKLRCMLRWQTMAHDGGDVDDDDTRFRYHVELSDADAKIF